MARTSTIAASPGASSPEPVARIALATAAGYYLGVLLGFALRYPPATTSLLWPPNAILTAALLLVPPRRWWICLAAVFPVHLLLELDAGFPWTLVLGLFATNCSEALIAAGGIWLYSDNPRRLDTLRRVTVFLVAAVVVAPVVSSFADAAVVSLVQGESYWAVWRTRVFANALTELAIVPLVLGLVSRDWIRTVRLREIGELTALVAVLVLTGLFVFDRIDGRIDFLSLPRTPTPLLLPPLFWAAIRFGPAGLGMALLVFGLVASAAAISGRRPFVNLTPIESAAALQMSLLVMTIPLMCITALLAEKRAAERTMAGRLTFQALLGRLSASFVSLSSDEMLVAFGACLERIGEFFAVDRAAVMQLDPSGSDLIILEQWAAPDVVRLPSVYSCNHFPWVVTELLNGNAVACESIADLPAAAAADRESFAAIGLRAALVVPLVASGRVHGVLSLHMTRSERTWAAEMREQLRLVAEVLASALARKRVEDALRLSESMKSAILESFSSSIAVLDRKGTVIATNASWGRTADLQPDRLTGVSYLASGTRGSGEADSRRAHDGIRSVLDGRTRHFSYEYAASVGGAERWFSMTVVPLLRPEGGAVVTHTDISDRKAAEIEADRARHELAHVTRMSAMGELTSSLAHQLNQPLTGILSNAQAAQHYLTSAMPDTGELRDILLDIIDDDRRAGDVIRRLREMVARPENGSVVLDLHALLRDVALLMNSDTIIRNVPLAFELSPGPARISGNRIELQQVFVHLLVNAMDAVAEVPVHERTVVVRSARTNDLSVVVSVSDRGVGIPEGSETQIFEPFFTTKAPSLGMGLAIARSIVEAHGGHISACHNPPRGATFHVTLPLVPEMVM